MTKPGANLAKLAELSALLRETEIAKLASATAKCRAIEQDLLALRVQRAARATQVKAGQAPDIASLSGADEKWQIFLDQQSHDLVQRLAHEMAAVEEIKTSAQRALGRSDVLKKLAEKKR